MRSAYFLLVACSSAEAPARRTAAPAPSTTAAPVALDAGRERPGTDPAPLGRVLSAYVVHGFFDYAGLRADVARRADLDAFLADVADDPSPDLATLLDAYNAFVIAEVVSGEPVRSVMDVRGFFDRPKRRVGGREVSLNQLEKEWILPEFHDARVHFALNCGARSCPALQSEPFRQVDLEATLERVTREALGNDVHLRLEGRSVRVTSLFDWYRADFEPSGGVVAFIRRYRADVPEDARVGFLRYDWRINEAPPRE